jgi:hypothetical protein
VVITDGGSTIEYALLNALTDAVVWSVTQSVVGNEFTYPATNFRPFVWDEKTTTTTSTSEVARIDSIGWGAIKGFVKTTGRSV